MKLLSRLFNRSKTSATLTCPRCLGKGHVDKADIIRLKQQGKWGTGACAYCERSGIVDKELLLKVAVDTTSLTNNLTPNRKGSYYQQNPTIRLPGHGTQPALAGRRLSPARGPFWYRKDTAATDTDAAPFRLSDNL